MYCSARLDPPNTSSSLDDQSHRAGGSGFTPNTDPRFTAVDLTYTNGDLGAYTPLAADGSFLTNVFMPTEFIGSSSGRKKTYTLTATDRNNPALTDSAEATLVRAG